MLFIKPADLREIVTFPLFSDLVQSFTGRRLH